MEPTEKLSPVGRPYEVRPSGRLRKVPAPPPAGDADRVSLSQEGQELLAVRKRIEQAPDVREDVVERVRQAIREGRFDVPAREIARRLVRVLRVRE